MKQMKRLGLLAAALAVAASMMSMPATASSSDVLKIQPTQATGQPAVDYATPMKTLDLGRAADAMPVLLASTGSAGAAPLLLSVNVDKTYSAVDLAARLGASTAAVAPYSRE